MYVRDELGDFSECAYSLLLSYRSSHPSRGGDQQQLVTASLRFNLPNSSMLLLVGIRFIAIFALRGVGDDDFAPSFVVE